MNKVDWSKPVETTCGRPVKVLCTDLDNSKFPVVIAIRMNIGSDEYYIPYACSHLGAVLKTQIAVRNVAPKKVTREGWVNIYDDGYTSDSIRCTTNIFDTAENAERHGAMAWGGRKNIATIRIEWDEPQ